MTEIKTDKPKMTAKPPKAATENSNPRRENNKKERRTLPKVVKEADIGDGQRGRTKGSRDIVFIKIGDIKTIIFTIEHVDKGTSSRDGESSTLSIGR